MNASAAAGTVLALPSHEVSGSFCPQHQSLVRSALRSSETWDTFGRGVGIGKIRALTVTRRAAGYMGRPVSEIELREYACIIVVPIGQAGHDRLSGLSHAGDASRNCSKLMTFMIIFTRWPSSESGRRRFSQPRRDPSGPT